jgi:hypothetical protein
MPFPQKLCRCFFFLALPGREPDRDEYGSLQGNGPILGILANTGRKLKIEFMQNFELSSTRKR